MGKGSLHGDICVREVFIEFSCVLDQEEFEQLETGRSCCGHCERVET